LQGEYIIFTAHRVENNAFRQQFSVAYTDFTTPAGSSATVLAAIQAIIDSYATPDPKGYYGAFSDVTDQNAAVINTGYPMLLGVTDLSNGVTVEGGSRVTIANTGIYNIQWSAQFRNPESSIHDVIIWLRKNGVDVPGSSGLVAVTGSHGGVDGHVLPSWNFLLDVIAGDYYQFVWSTNDTSVFISFEPAGSPPPSTASVVLTVTQQSGIMAGTGMTALNGLSGAVQTLATNGSGTDFNIASTGATHTFNLPTASATNRGALSTSNWSTFNSKLTGFGQFRKASRWYNNGMLALGNASFGNVNGAIRYIPVFIDQDITITRLGINVNTLGPVGSLCRLGIYSNDTATTQPLTRLVDAGTVTLDGATGQRSITGLSVALTKGLYWFAYFSNAASGTITRNTPSGCRQRRHSFKKYGRSSIGSRCSR
jgi:hypothetical protein